jgi:hypothetical protein
VSVRTRTGEPLRAYEMVIPIFWYGSDYGLLAMARARVFGELRVE